MSTGSLGSELADVVVAAPCRTCSLERTVLRVNTVDFDVLTRDQFTATMDRFLRCGKSHVVHFLAAHPTVIAREAGEFRQLLNSGDLVVADGTPIALMMRAKGHKAHRITATDGFVAVCSADVASGAKHFFLGGADLRTATSLRKELRRRFPELTIAGFEVPPFRPYTDAELAALVGNIRRSETDVLWIGLGAPKQDILAHRLRALDAAPAIVCIGAVVDFVAKTKPRAPSLMRATGLEWLFRLMLEPRRLWRRYLIGNVKFVAGIMSDETRRWVGRRPFRRPAGP